MCSICAGIGQSAIPSLSQMAYFGLVKLSGALVLVLVGAINWGLVGALNWNVVTALFGGWPWLTSLLYVLVGASGLYMAWQVSQEK